MEQHLRIPPNRHNGGACALQRSKKCAIEQASLTSVLTLLYKNRVQHSILAR